MPRTVVFALALAALALGGACASRARQSYEAGRAAEASGQMDEAVANYRRAVSADPEDVEYRIALMLAEEQARRARVPPVDRPRGRAPNLAHDRLSEIRVDLVFEDTSLAEVFRALGRLAEINILFDEAYRDVRVSLDLRGLTLGAALELIAETHGLFLHLER